VKVDNQSKKLSKLVESKSNLPRYEIILPPFGIKKSDQKNLKTDSVIDTALSGLEFWMIDDTTQLVAKLSLQKDGRHYKLVITEVTKESLETKEYKKAFFASLGYIQSRLLKLNHKIDISTLNFEDISIRQNTKEIAKSKMVWLNQKVSLQITKVYV
jgi:hypothetical protein